MQDLRKTTASKFITNFLGSVEYSAALKIQNELLLQVQNTNCHYIIGLEHPAVITLGYRANAAEEVHSGSGIKIEKVARGGFATIHSEGQLVIYPVVHLRKLGLGVRNYVCLLLQTTRKVMKKFGIESFVNDQALGLYTANGKIAFCGIQVRQGITQHGISININNDLSLFESIRSCGVQDAKFDRAANYGSLPDISVFYSEWVQEFIHSIEEQS